MDYKPLSGKTGIVLGVANKRSMAWAIAQAWHEAGAKLIFSYQGERVKENVEQLTATFGADVALAPCDVTSDDEIKSFIDFVRTKTDSLDLMLHSVAFAPREALEGDFLSTTRDAFLVAHNVSAYSLLGVTREAAPLFNPGASILTMSFYGAEKVFPHYNVMGVAKASLEATVRYLAYDLGEKNVRINAISAGPVQTLAARGIAGFSDMMKIYNEHAPLRRSCTLEEIGATALFLALPGAGGITGQTIYVDGGYEIMGL